jgi:hypothetical protein
MIIWLDIKKNYATSSRLLRLLERHRYSNTLEPQRFFSEPEPLFATLNFVLIHVGAGAIFIRSHITMI